MSEQLYSSMWYRVADLRPELRLGVDIREHRYRGKAVYVIVDAASSRSHKFSNIAHHLVRLMNGQRSVEELWQLTENKFGDDAPTQDEVIELLSRLHEADLLQTEVSPDVQELLSRYQKQRINDWKQRFANPLTLRFAIFDPTPFLNRTLKYVEPVFTSTGFLIWLATVLSAVVLALLHWPELTAASIDEIVTPGNLVLVWFCYPLVKLLHELGHAYTARRWGCEVHELGLMFLVLIPLPYVDASSSAALADKRGRMLIAGMGIMTELFIASLALFIWLLVESGAVHTLAYSIMMISGISTLLFNGNPLLRFDGYFVLADALEIPNLSSRSQSYLGYLVERYVFKIDGLKSPAMSHDERFWLVAYGVSAFVFRYIVMVGIILYIADKFFVFGLLLAIWAVVAHGLMPLGRRLSYLLASPRLARQRSRALGVSLTTVFAFAILLFAVPAPLATLTEGVVWTPDESEVRAKADAFVTVLVADPDSPVTAGEVLLITEDPELAANVAILGADLREATVRYNSLRMIDEIEAGNIQEEIKSIKANLSRARERLAGLTIYSPSDGMFLIDRPQDVEGRYLKQGDVVGYVADMSSATVRVAVTQEDIGLIRSRTRRVSLRFADDPHTEVPATVRREVPAASDRLPSAVLGAAGGGQIAIDAQDEKGTQTIQSVFHIELDVARPVAQIGGRTYVRFSHGFEPLGVQWYRRIRQLFLRRFDV